MKAPRSIWLIPPLVGMAAAIAGYFDSSSSVTARSTSEARTVTTNTTNVESSTETNQSPTASNELSGEKSTPAARILKVGSETLDQILAYPSELHRRGALKRFFERMSPTQFPIAFGEIMRRQDLADSEVLPMLFRGWAECAPMDAGRFALTLPPGSQRATIIGAFIRAWLRKDFAAAKEWGERELKSSELMELQRYATELEGYAAIALPPPVRTLDEALALPVDQRLAAVGRMLKQRAATDVPGVLADIEKITDPLLKTSLLYNVLRNCAERDPLATLRWVDKQPNASGDGEIYRDPMSTARWAAFYDLAAKDPSTARSHIANLSPGLLRDQSADALATTMFKTDRAGAIAYCEEYAASTPGAPFGALLKAWLPEDPERAGARLLDYLNTKFPGEHAQRAGSWTANIMALWVQRDAQSAAKFAATLPEGTQQSVFVDVAKQWCRQDGAKALEWAAALPEGPTRNTALLEFVYAWSQHDSTQTSAWLERLPNGAGRWAATEGFVVSVMDTDADGALSWARTIPDEGRRHALLRRSWQRWLEQNPTNAQRWLTSAPLSESERTAIAGQ